MHAYSTACDKGKTDDNTSKVDTHPAPTNDGKESAAENAESAVCSKEGTSKQSGKEEVVE